MKSLLSTAKIDEKGRIVLPADLTARLKMSPGDEFVIGEATSDSILLKKKDLRTIFEGVIKKRPGRWISISLSGM